ncbi:MAG: hypothetical protein ACRDHL_10800, partial [Candidatus Promineifilaceae bacterium]
RLAGTALFGAAVMAGLLFGGRQQLTIINASTVLATAADRAGLAWLAENTPPDARIAVNSWRWLGNTWAAADGGAWIVPLTGRRATTPPADYVYDRALYAQVNAFNAAAAAVEDWSAPAAGRWLAEQGVTHLYVGPKGGFFDPAALARNPTLRQVYGRDGVFIFEAP